MRTKYKIGDVVKVIDAGHLYSTYDAWPGIPSGHSLYNDVRGGKYTIINIEKHEDDDNVLLALTNERLKPNKQIIIMDQKGVKKAKPSIETRIQAAINSPEFIDKVAEAVLSKQDKAVEPEAVGPVIDYPYVGSFEDSIVLFTDEEGSELTGIRLSGAEGPCTKIGVSDCSWVKSVFKPFDGTITYKAGKPVKTEETK